MTGFEVRTATYDDMGAIAEITKEAFEKYAELADIDPQKFEPLCETADDIRRDIEGKIVLVAFMDGMPVGSVRIAVDIEAKTAYMSRFGVKLSMQNNGIGKSLINLVDMKMRSLGIKRLSLHTGSRISPLVRFYYGRGFYIDSTSKDKGYIRALLHKDYR